MRDRPILVMGASLAVAFAALGSEAGEGTRWKLSTGFDYSRGHYGLEDDTEYYYVPVSVEAEFFPVRARISLPLLHAEGPEIVFEDDGTEGRRRSTGLGQLVASVGYLWTPASAPWPYLEFSLHGTAPTETHRELGNGAWALAPQLEAFQRYGAVTVFGNGGRKFYTGSRIQDRFYASVGASLRLHPRLQFGLAYDWLEANTDTMQDIHQISPFFGIELANAWRLGPYGTIGLSNGAPDVGLGLTMSRTLPGGTATP